jgi:hypothetical protein
MTTSTERTTDQTSPRGSDPAEGRPDVGGPGANREASPDPEPPTQEAPGAPEDDAPARLGERIQDGPGGGIAAGEPDLLPNVETPDSTM